MDGVSRNIGNWLAKVTAWGYATENIHTPTDFESSLVRIWLSAEDLET